MEALRSENVKLKLEKAKHEASLAQFRSTVASLQQDLKIIHEEYTKLEQTYEARLKEQADRSNQLLQSLVEQLYARAALPEASPFEATLANREENVDQAKAMAGKRRSPKSKEALLQLLEAKKAASPHKYITPIRTDSNSQPTHCSREGTLSSFNDSGHKLIQPIDIKNGAIDSSAFRSLALLGNYTILKDSVFRQHDASPLSAD